MRGHKFGPEPHFRNADRQNMPPRGREFALLDPRSTSAPTVGHGRPAAARLSGFGRLLWRLAPMPSPPVSGSQVLRRGALARWARVELVDLADLPGPERFLVLSGGGVGQQPQIGRQGVEAGAGVVAVQVTAWPARRSMQSGRRRATRGCRRGDAVGRRLVDHRATPGTAAGTTSVNAPHGPTRPSPKLSGRPNACLQMPPTTHLPTRRGT